MGKGTLYHGGVQGNREDRVEEAEANIADYFIFQPEDQESLGDY